MKLNEMWGQGRRTARVVLSVTVALALSAAAQAGSLNAMAQTPTPTPTSSGAPTPAIFLLNPSAATNPPGLDPTGGEVPDSPNISDKFDGVDSMYHVVALTSNLPANSVIETYWTADGGNEVTAGIMSPVAGTSDTWELFWDIPSSLPEGEGVFKASVFQQTTSGFEEVAKDEEAATLQHEGKYSDPDDSPAEETVEFTWPTQNGPLGFYKPRAGSWKARVEGRASGGELIGNRRPGSAQRIFVRYSVTPVGKEPVFTDCGTVDPNQTPAADGALTWKMTCTLAGKDTPSQITALTAVASEADQPTGSGLLRQDSADTHRVHGFAQLPDDMKVSIIPRPGTTSATWPTGARRTAGSDCLNFDVFVQDQMDRPVLGANIDVHLQGPTDQVGFGDDDTSSTGQSSTYQTPDKGGHSTENGWDCLTIGDPWDTQGDHNIPGSPDIKHRESVSGSGLSGPNSIDPGKWRFQVLSFDVGFTDITAWVDDEDLPVESEARPADNDTKEEGEPFATMRAQWLPQGVSIAFDPTGDSAAAGTCNPYTVKVRSGSAAVPGINVDVHATGPTDDLDFCDPAEGTPRRAPQGGNHQSEDDGESSHAGGSPQTQHTEGETNEAGNFIIGITSPVSGDTTLVGWIDGEAGSDNDIQDAGELAASATKSWASSAGEAEVRFVNPSGYGGAGDNVSNLRDSDTNFHIVTRVDAPELIPGVEILLRSSSGTSKVGDAIRVGESDTYELYWDTKSLAAGDYTLIAQIVGTTQVEERDIHIDNTQESLELTKPLNGASAPFTKGATPVEGIASVGTESVDIYYTTTPAGKSRETGDWKLCASVTLNGGGTAAQSFAGQCKLVTADNPSQVSGFAAVSVDCDEMFGCSSDSPLGSEAAETGDAHRVFGLEANPLITIEPAESSGQVGTCQKFTATVRDQTGQPIVARNVDFHLSGPDDGARFCDAEGGSDGRPPDQGGHSGVDQNQSSHPSDGPDQMHTEGETNANGNFIIGVISNTAGDMNVTGWIDGDDNDNQDANEPSDSSIMHWLASTGCDITGTPDDDILVGTSEGEKICGGGGNDTIRGKGGDDVVVGGKGGDFIFGGAGDDLLKGRRGADEIHGGPGEDTCFGGRGRDSIKSCEKGKT